jgi:DNA invertase Pin-like site-specific DNA recombinase
MIYTRTAAMTGQDVLQRQLKQCRAYAIEHGWDIVGEYHDTGSGRAGSRPGLDAAMELVRSRRCDRLVTSDMSRFTRSASDARTILANADTADVAIVTADGSIDTSTELGVMMARAMVKFAGRWDEGRRQDASAD